MIIIIYKKIHLNQPFHECSLIKQQIFKCTWEINTDQELSGLFVYSETGKSFSSLLCRVIMGCPGIPSTLPALLLPAALLFSVPGGFLQPWWGLFQYWWGFQDAFPCLGTTAAASHKVCNWLLESNSHHSNSCRLKCCTETRHQHLWQLRRLINIHKESRGA